METKLEGPILPGASPKSLDAPDQAGILPLPKKGSLAAAQIKPPAKVTPPRLPVKKERFLTKAGPLDMQLSKGCQRKTENPTRGKQKPS